MNDEIVLYSAKMCSDCQHLKRFLDNHEVPYKLRDIHEDPEHKEVLQEKTGKLGVPYLVINGQWKRGYDPGKPFSETFARELIGIQN